MSLANSFRTLKAYISSVKTELGAGFGAAIRHVIVWLNSLMKHIVVASKYFRQFMETIFGKYKGGASGMAFDASQLEDADTYASDLSDSASNAADGLEDASSAAKKLKDKLSVLPFDELNQLSKDTSDNSKVKGIADGLGGYGDALADLLKFDDSEREMSDFEKYINNWAERLKTYFKSQNWEMLGRALAQGLNKGINALYDVLNPERAKKKIFKWIDAFTRTFNSFINYLDFNKLGRAIGEGINILVSSLNRILDPKTGIDWKTLGVKFAQGLNGLTDEIDFTEIGKFIGNKLMVFWRILEGFAKEFDWVELGRKLGDGVNGLNSAINWDTVANALVESINGAFDTLRRFIITVDWHEIADNISSGINTAIKKFDWKRNAQTLNAFILDLLGTLVEIVKDTDWESLGAGIADALHEIQWTKILSKVADMIITTLGGLIKGLISEPEGTFVVALGVGFASIKVGSAIDKLTGNIATYISGKKSVGVIQKAFQDLFADGLATIAPSLVPVSVAIAGIAGGIYNAKTYIENDMPKLSADVKLLSDDCDEAIEKLGSIRTNGESTLSALEEKYETNKKLAEPLIETLRKLAEKTGALTEAEKRQKNDAINGLIEIYPELNGMISEQDTNLGKVVSTVEDYIKNVAELAKAEVYYEQIKEATKALVNIEREQQTVGKEISDIQEKLSAKYREAAPIVKAVAEAYGVEAKDLNDLTKILQEHSGEMLTVNGQTQQAGWFAEQLAKNFGKEGENAENLYVQLGTLNDKLSELNTAHSEGEKDIESWQTRLSSSKEMTENATSTMNNFETTFSKMGGTLLDVNRGLDGNASAIERTATASEGVQDKLKNVNEHLSNQAELASNAATEQSRYNDAANATPSIFSTISTLLGGLSATLLSSFGNRSDYEGVAKDNLGGFKSGIDDNVESLVTDPLSNASKEGLQNMSDEKKTKDAGRYLVYGISKGIKDNVNSVTNAISWLNGEMMKKYKEDNKIQSPSKVYETESENIPLGIVNGIKNKVGDVLNGITSLCDNMRDKFSTEFSSLNALLFGYAGDLVDSISDGFDSKAISIDFNIKVRNMFSDLSSTINSIKSTFYQYGNSIAQAMSNGLSSVHISLPHIEWNGSYSKMITGPNSWWNIPNYKVSWYARGALFTNPSVVGLGEAGDEAAIPLENKQAMSRIANAITDNMKNVGIDERELASAITQGYINAMMATQSQNQQDPTFNITIRTMNDEVLARAVQRGNRSINYRNNPSAI